MARGSRSRRDLHSAVVSLGPEHLVMGHLMRRDFLLACKTPPSNEGCDLAASIPIRARLAPMGRAARAASRLT